MGDIENPDQGVTINIDVKVEKEVARTAGDVIKKLGKIQIINGNNAGKKLTLDKSLTAFGKPGTAVVGITNRNRQYFISQSFGKSGRAFDQERTSSYCLYCWP